MIKVALDVDDVLAAFVPHAAKWANVPLQKMNYWSVEEMAQRYGKDWFTSIAQVKEFWETLPVLNKPQDINFEVDCYISSFPKEMYDVRAKWLKENGFPDKPLIVSSDKLTVCRERNIDILVDDKPQMMEILQDTEIVGVHFITSYAGFNPVGLYITSLKQVKDVIDAINIEQ